jgi:hypothetical protein
MGEALKSTCPEALVMPRRRLASLVATEPATLLRATLRALPQLQDWRLGYLGSVEGLRYAGSDSVRAVAGAPASSIGPLLAGVPSSVFLQMLAASAAIFLVSAVACVAAGVSGRSSPLALTLYALTGIAWYAVMTSIFGDGYVELARHAQLASVALYAAAVVLAAALFAPLLGIFGVANGRAVVAAAAFAVLAIGVSILGEAPLRYAMSATPMAFGVVDRPRQNKVAGGEVEWSGWAIDPQGVARVELVVDGAAFPARYGLPYRGAHDEPLTLYFPAYPNTANAGFAGEIDRRKLITEAR